MRLFAALFVLVGIVVSPLRAVAATIPMLIAYDAEVRPTAMRALGRPDAVGSEKERAQAACDDATFAYDDSSTPPVAAGAGAVCAYDDALNLADRRGVGEGAIYDAPLPDGRRRGGYVASVDGGRPRPFGSWDRRGDGNGHQPGNDSDVVRRDARRRRTRNDSGG